VNAVANITTFLAFAKTIEEKSFLFF